MPASKSAMHLCLPVHMEEFSLQAQGHPGPGFLTQFVRLLVQGVTHSHVVPLHTPKGC